MSFKAIKFSNPVNPNIPSILRKRVKDYFDEKKLERHGNKEMVFKTIFMICLYFIPYGFLISGLISSPFIIFAMFLLMSAGMSGIGLSVMHDANHGSYSRNPKVNSVLSYLINIIGGNSLNWRIQHNVLHHTYTNIDGHDDDIGSGFLMRLTPHQKKLFFHRYQHLYGWFIYAQMTIYWLLGKDFVQLFSYYKQGLLKSQKRNFLFAFIELIFFKALYLFLFLVLPIIILPIPWWMTILFFYSMHLASGLFLACVFQCAHIMPSSDYKMADEDLVHEHNWAVHQFYNTANFSQTNRFLSWFIGGLNFQIEHHLFPNICHIHYRKIAPIIKNTAEEYGIPYNEYGGFFNALCEHAKMLKRFGYNQ